MYMVYTSTYLYLLQLLSSMSSTFPCTDLLYPWLGLCLDIFIFCLKQVWMGLFSKLPFLLVHYWYIKMQMSLDINFVPFYLVNSSTSSSTFLVKSLGFFMYTIMTSENTESFTSSFPNWMPFISSVGPIAVARITSTMLNKRGEIEHPCLVSNLKGKACSFSCWAWGWQWVCNIWSLLCLFSSLFFYYCLSKVVSIFPPPLPCATAIPPPTLDTIQLWFCPCVLYTGSLNSHSPFTSIIPFNLPYGYCQFDRNFSVSGYILHACLLCWLGST